MTNFGLVEYSLKTKMSKQYSTSDGLASNSNIGLNPDPSDNAPVVTRTKRWVNRDQRISEDVILCAYNANNEILYFD